MAVKPHTVSGFIAELQPGHAALVKEIRAAVRAAAPKAEESVKQGWLFSERRGPICFIQPHPVRAAGKLDVEKPYT